MDHRPGQRGRHCPTEVPMGALCGAHPPSSGVLSLGFSSSRRGPWSCQWAPRLCPAVLGDTSQGQPAPQCCCYHQHHRSLDRLLRCLQVALRAGTGPGPHVTDYSPSFPPLSLGCREPLPGRHLICIEPCVTESNSLSLCHHRPGPLPPLYTALARSKGMMETSSLGMADSTT